MFICSDSNIWFDFQAIQHLDHPFRLEHTYYMSQDTFTDELLKPESIQADLKALGLQLVEMAEEEFQDALAYQSQYKALSKHDTYALAIAKHRGWTLLTGDMPLRKAADREGIKVHGTIWIYDQLKAQSRMTDDEYASAIGMLIEAVKSGLCRLPLSELARRQQQGYTTLSRG